MYADASLSEGLSTKFIFNHQAALPIIAEAIEVAEDDARETQDLSAATDAVTAQIEEPPDFGEDDDSKREVKEEPEGDVGAIRTAQTGTTGAGLAAVIGF